MTLEGRARQGRQAALVSARAGIAGIESLPRNAEAVRDAITRAISTMPEQLRRSLTWDQGAELAQHARLKIDAGMQVYFCDPHSPWQRGSNENANGLIREYLPKGSNLNLVTHQQLTSIEYALNNRPRKILGFRTPAEVFANLKLNNLAGVALQA